MSSMMISTIRMNRKFCTLSSKIANSFRARWHSRSGRTMQRDDHSRETHTWHVYVTLALGFCAHDASGQHGLPGLPQVPRGIMRALVALVASPARASSCTASTARSDAPVAACTSSLSGGNLPLKSAFAVLFTSGCARDRDIQCCALYTCVRSWQCRSMGLWYMRATETHRQLIYTISYTIVLDLVLLYMPHVGSRKIEWM